MSMFQKTAQEALSALSQYQNAASQQGPGNIAGLQAQSLGGAYGLQNLGMYPGQVVQTVTNCSPLQFAPSPLPIKKLPQETVLAAIVGWRRWSVPMFEDVLISTNGTRWIPSQKLQAHCAAGDAGCCKGILCTCGIYCYKIRSQVETLENQPTENTHVYGEVYLWGRVVEHEHGYRAQFAYPKSLVGVEGIQHKLAQAYRLSLIP